MRSLQRGFQLSGVDSASKLLRAQDWPHQLCPTSKKRTHLPNKLHLRHRGLHLHFICSKAERVISCVPYARVLNPPWRVHLLLLLLCVLEGNRIMMQKSRRRYFQPGGSYRWDSFIISSRASKSLPSKCCVAVQALSCSIWVVSKARHFKGCWTLLFPKWISTRTFDVRVLGIWYTGGNFQHQMILQVPFPSTFQVEPTFTNTWGSAGWNGELSGGFFPPYFLFLCPLTKIFSLPPSFKLGH